MNRRDIVKAQFSRAFRGYDVREVDEFLDMVSECLEANETEIESLKKKNDELLHALLYECPAEEKADDDEDKEHSET